MFKKTHVATGVLIALGSALAAPAFAQEKIEITGSRIKSLSVEGTSPVTVIGAEDIKVEGARNVENFLNNLPQVFADQGSSVSNGATGTATVNLRGLGADRTLVLVNGRRMPMGSPNSTAPDLNQIPAGLIKRVEVLTGGASAVYGSDAVAGVVNFILNDKFEGVQIDLNHNFFQHKQSNTAGVASIVTARAATNPAEFKVPGNKSADGKSTNFSVLMGGNFDGGKGNATLFLNYKADDALLQSERDYSACTVSSTAAGFVCGGSGTNATGRITVLGGPNNGKVFTNGDRMGTARPFANATDQYNFGPLNHYQRPSERYGFNAMANYQAAPNVKAYTELSFHDDQTVAQIAPGGAFGSIHTASFDNPLLSASWKQALGLVNPGDTRDFVLQRRNVEGGGRQSEFRNTSFRGVVGAKGDIGVFSYDAYAIAAKVIYSQNERNYFLTPRIAKAMDVVNVNGVAQCKSFVDGTDPACVPYNPWLLGGVTKAQLDYLQTPGFRKGSTELKAQGINLSTDLGEFGVKLPGAREGVSLAFGFEKRSEALSLETDSATANGDLSGSGGPTKGLSGANSVKDVFAEVRIPILERQPLAESLALNASARRSSYSTDINANTYGVGAEWAPSKAGKLRGSYQKASRAPNLAELFTAQGNNLFDMDSDPCAGPTPKRSLAECQRTGVTAAQYGNIQDSPAGQYNFLQGGNPNLKPEDANSVTLGFVLTPNKNLNFNVDYFDIKIKSTIGNIDPETTLTKCLDSGDPTFCSLIQRDRLGTLWLLPESKIVATNQNIGSTRTSGFDLGANYGMGLGAMGSLNLSAVGTLLRKLEVEPIKGSGSYDCVGLYNGAGKCGTPNPKWRHKVRAAWATPYNVDVTVSWRYFGGVQIEKTSSNPLLAGTFNAVDNNLKAQNYFDLAGSWRATKQFTLTGGINNLFDKAPPITSQTGAGAGNGNTFPQVYDALGRRVFVAGSYKF